jgi:ribonuclease HI
MEMLAVVNALRHLASFPASPHTIYTDSAYVFNCFDAKWYVRWRLNGWKNMSGDPVKNKDLWEEMLSLYEQLQVTILKTQAHKDDEYNNLADKTAVKARKALEKEGDK